MNGGVSRIFKLLGNPRAGNFFGESFGAGDGAFHSFGSWGEFEFCAEESEKSAPFEAHAFGHGQNQFVAFGGGDESEGDAGVS